MMAGGVAGVSPRMAIGNLTGSLFMATQASSETQDQLKLILRIDDQRAADDPFKLPALLRADVAADLATLIDTDGDTPLKEGDRAAASNRRRRALQELERQLRGGYRFIAAIDEEQISEDERMKVFAAYGWKGGKIGAALDDDDAVLANARLALKVGAEEVPNAAHRYPAARLTRIQTQLGIAEVDQATATGGDRQLATKLRDAALETASTTALRTRFYYCSASRDADQTPELARINFQPRRDPGTASRPEAPAPSPAAPVPPKP